MDVPGVPASITRDQYSSLLAGAGLNGEDLQSLEFRADGIYAEVIAKDESGRPIVDFGKNEVVCHTVYIPVRD